MYNKAEDIETELIEIRAKQDTIETERCTRNSVEVFKREKMQIVGKYEDTCFEWESKR